MTRYDSVVVTLTIGRDVPTSITGQTVELDREPDTIITGVDGHTSIARHPWTVVWHGKAAADLKAQFIGVKIARCDGLLLVNGSINRNFESPHDVPKGVQFQV
jgi:hypothetical protein